MCFQLRVKFICIEYEKSFFFLIQKSIYQSVAECYSFLQRLTILKSYSFIDATIKLLHQDFATKCKLKEREKWRDYQGKKGSRDEKGREDYQKKMFSKHIAGQEFIMERNNLFRFLIVKKNSVSYQIKILSIFQIM